MTTHHEMPEKDKTREMPRPGQPGQEQQEKDRRNPHPDRPFEQPERPHPGSERHGEAERPQRQGGQPDRR
jgi:hypothetical protein